MGVLATINEVLTTETKYNYKERLNIAPVICVPGLRSSEIIKQCDSRMYIYTPVHIRKLAPVLAVIQDVETS